MSDDPRSRYLAWAKLQELAHGDELIRTMLVLIEQNPAQREQLLVYALLSSRDQCKFYQKMITEYNFSQVQFMNKTREIMLNILGVKGDVNE